MYMTQGHLSILMSKVLKKISNPNLGNSITVVELGNVLKKFKIINHQELTESPSSSCFSSMPF